MTRTYAMVPAGGGTWLILLLILPVVIGAIVVLGASLMGSRGARFEVSATTLTLRGDWYGRAIARRAIDANGVRVVDLDREARLQPIRRTLGTGLPGYRAGWFRLADGEKALLYVTDTSRVVYVPTTEGYSLLLSAADADGLAADLRSGTP